MNLVRAMLIAGLSLYAQMCQASPADEALALLKKAHDVTDIRSLGPLYLSATFKIKGSVGPRSEGKYQLLWVNEGKWRDEVVVASGQAQVRIGSGEQVYVDTNSPGAAFGDAIINLIDAGKYLQLWPGETFVKLKAMKKNTAGLEAQCVVVRDAQSIEYEAACIENASGKALTTINNSVQYSAYTAVSNKMFPTDIETPDISLHVDLITLTNEFPANSFDPPKDSKTIEHSTQATPPLITRTESHHTVQSGCYSIIPAQVVKTYPPVVPEIAYKIDLSGIVVAEIWIDESGMPSVNKVTGDPMYAPGVKASVTKQTYSPAHCGSRNVASSIRLQYYFLQGNDNHTSFCDGSRYSSDPWCKGK